MNLSFRIIAVYHMQPIKHYFIKYRFMYQLSGLVVKCVT